MSDTFLLLGGAIRFVVIAVALATQFVGGRAAAVADANAERGQQLYESRCIACHSLDANRVGPLHRDVYGRQAGTAPGYGYSPALAASRFIWTDDILDAWLADPESLVPGQRMNIRVSNASDRIDLIAYLKRESGN